MWARDCKGAGFVYESGRINKSVDMQVLIVKLFILQLKKQQMLNGKATSLVAVISLGARDIIM